MSDTGSLLPSSNEAIRECLESISIGTRALQKKGIELADYKLIAVENLIYEPDNIWFLKFKPRDLLPKDADTLIGAGGELMVRVNIKSKSCLVTHGD